MFDKNCVCYIITSLLKCSSQDPFPAQHGGQLMLHPLWQRFCWEAKGNPWKVWMPAGSSFSKDLTVLWNAQAERPWG